ncbi:MAG: uroporphyrinogen-III synthase [Alphaproteobacteria bacterium]|nr:uroporphyrinogen-III synthase [Alphaproteobacteria bacterium]
MEFIITRPEVHTTELKQQLQGYPVTFLPVMKFEDYPDVLEHAATQVCDYIVTSPFVAKKMRDYPFDRNAYYYCVGQITANILGEFLPHVYAPCAQNAHSLEQFIVQHHKPERSDRLLVYLSGAEIRRPIHLSLMDQGIMCERLIAYDTKSMTHDLTHLFSGTRPKCIVFYSKRSYDLFIANVRMNGMVDKLAMHQALWVLPDSDHTKLKNYCDDTIWKDVKTLPSTIDLIHYIKTQG